MKSALLAVTLLAACGADQYPYYEVGPDIGAVGAALYEIERHTCDFARLVDFSGVDLAVAFSAGCHWGQYRTHPWGEYRPTVFILHPACDSEPHWGTPLAVHEILHAIWSHDHDDPAEYPCSVMLPVIPYCWQIEQHHIDAINERFCQ